MNVKWPMHCHHVWSVLHPISRSPALQYLLHKDCSSCNMLGPPYRNPYHLFLWSWVPCDSDQRMTALVRATSNCKWQTCPLVREVAPHQQILSCLTVIKMWSWAPDGCLTPKQTDLTLTLRTLTKGIRGGLRVRNEWVEWSSGAAAVRCQPARREARYMVTRSNSQSWVESAQISK
jgi:hypothetical protein